METNPTTPTPTFNYEYVLRVFKRRSLCLFFASDIYPTLERVMERVEPPQDDSSTRLHCTGKKVYEEVVDLFSIDVSFDIAEMLNLQCQDSVEVSNWLRAHFAEKYTDYEIATKTKVNAISTALTHLYTSFYAVSFPSKTLKKAVKEPTEENIIDAILELFVFKSETMKTAFRDTLVKMWTMDVLKSFKSNNAEAVSKAYEKVKKEVVGTLMLKKGMRNLPSHTIEGLNEHLFDILVAEKEKGLLYPSISNIAYLTLD